MGGSGLAESLAVENAGAIGELVGQRAAAAEVQRKIKLLKAAERYTEIQKSVASAKSKLYGPGKIRQKAVSSPVAMSDRPTWQKIAEMERARRLQDVEATNRTSIATSRTSDNAQIWRGALPRYLPDCSSVIFCSRKDRSMPRKSSR